MEYYTVYLIDLSFYLLCQTSLHLLSFLSPSALYFIKIKQVWSIQRPAQE